MNTNIGAVLAQRLWQAMSGVVTMLLITYYMTPEQQGWYYSFLTLTTPYLFDLGLSAVALQVAAHESVLFDKSQGAILGSESARFKCLIAKMARWYSWLGVACIVLLLPLGLLVFQTTSPALTWAPHWVVLVVISGAGLIVLPYLAIAEGLGRMKEVYSVRLAQGIFGAIFCWAVLVSGGGLWSVAMAPTAALIVPGIWLITQRHWIFPAIQEYDHNALPWRTEIWPLQWRLAVNLMCGYLLTQIYTPVLFHFQGAIPAGQMGLSLAIANTIGLIAQSWIARHVPAMGRAVACSDWGKLDVLFRRDFLLSSCLFVVGAIFICAGRVLFENTALASRLLPEREFIILFGVVFVNHVIGCLAAQLRSFRQEPLMWVAVVGTLLAIPIGVVAAQRYSSGGVVVTLFCVSVLVELPIAIWLWRRCNRDLRKQS